MIMFLLIFFYMILIVHLIYYIIFKADNDQIINFVIFFVYLVN
jgi:hypothetical protein